MIEEKEYKKKIGNKELIVKINNLTEQANGACFVQYGETTVLSTAVMSKYEKREIGFFPLTLEYEERYYAAGKIKGPRYVKRESRPSDEAICNARLIDRAVRPLFPKDFNREVEIINTVLSWDSKNDPDILGLIGSSIALLVSDIPWRGPIGAVRVGKIGDNFVLNPTYEEREESKIDVVFSVVEFPAVPEGVLVNMIEGSFNEAREKEILEAFEFAVPYLKKIISFQKEIKEKEGKEKIRVEKDSKEEIEEEARKILNSELEGALFEVDKEKREKRIENLREEVCKRIEEKYPEEVDYVKIFFEREIDRIVHKNILEKERRPDGRKLDEIRKVECRVNVIPRTHGSALFCRGRTKSLSILTLGGPNDMQLLEGMEISGKKRFMHHYNFPPYCAGEIKPLKGPGRREIGHGMLVERSLLPLLPPFEKFPYAVRIVSEILSSNGSTSMAAVSSSSLALMDAGVPIKKPATGIAIGLILADYKRYKLLTDIQGPEDHHGDMDFKIAGTEDGITGIQMDVKILGITKEIFKKALERGKKARLEILKEMRKAISKPREKLSPFAPKILGIKINPKKIRDVIGPGGKMINEIIEQCEVSVDIEEDGKIYVIGESRNAVEKAITWIKNITKEIKIGETFQGRVTRILHFGALVEILPGKEGLLHVSQFSGRCSLRPGKIVVVRVISIDELGRVNLSLVNPKFRPESLNRLKR